MKQRNSTRQKKEKNIKILIIIVSALIVVLIALLMFIKYGDTNTLSKIGIEKPQDNTNESSYGVSVTMPGWASITIPADSTNINQGVDFYNPTANVWFVCDKCASPLDANKTCTNEECGKQYTGVFDPPTDCYYLSFALYLKDNDELLYESKLVEPGQHLTNIEISRPLAAGTYDAYVFIQPYMSDQATPCNNGKVTIKLIAY